MHRPPIALVAVALAWGLLARPTPSRAQESELLGKWETALGVVRISQEGKKISGKLVWTNQTCPFAKNEEVLKGVLLEDSLAKTPWERMQANDDALRFAESLRAAMKERDAKPQRTDTPTR